MPRFQTRPVEVDAYQWTGNPNDVPEALAMAVARKPPLPGDLLVVWPGLPLEVVPPAAFEARFTEVPEEPAVHTMGVSTVTYVGDLADPTATPQRMEWLGYRFVLGHPAAVSDPVALASLRKNAHFVVTEPASVTAPDEVVIEAPPPVRRGPGRPPRASYSTPIMDAEASTAQEGEFHG